MAAYWLISDLSVSEKLVNRFLALLVSGKRRSMNWRITDYNAKVGWNHPHYKLHSTVISLILLSLGGQKLVLHVASFVRRSKAGAWHRHGIASCPDPLAPGGAREETRHGTP